MSMLGHYASYPLVTKHGLHECTCHGAAGSVGLFERHSCKPKGVIHVGAWDCAEMGCYVHIFEKNVVWVEANPQTFENLSKPQADAHGHRIFNYALGSVDNKEVSLKIMPKADGSSIYECVGQIPISEIKMKTKTLDTLIKEEEIDMSSYDFLNIDVEGAEHDVLEGMKENLHKIDYLFLEASLRERHKGTKKFKEMHEYIVDKGFKILEFSDSFRTLGWGDAFYRRNNKK